MNFNGTVLPIAQQAAKFGVEPQEQTAIFSSWKTSQVAGVPF